RFSFPLDSGSAQRPKGWVNYIIGVTYLMQQAGAVLEGVDVYIAGDLPTGAGMSSSAALCCGYAYGLNSLFGLGFHLKDLALIGQQTEHQFAGVKCGLMDQYACLNGKEGHVIKLDCRSLEFEWVPFHFPDVSIVLLNTLVHHNLADSEYNLRRQQCEEGVALLKRYYPDITSLREVSYEQLIRHWKEFNSVVYDRCTYVVNENQRLLAACDALRRDDLAGFGEMMYASHKGLSRRYAVSCPELDFLVEQARGFPGVSGARMMGGGFGGCTINIVQNEAIPGFIAAATRSYEAQFNKTPESYVVQLDDGVKVVYQPED
ncbi:MAG: galactokinase, partial [Bacteroidota bacterium]